MHAWFTQVGKGHVAELVYAYVSEAYVARLGSSSLPMPTDRNFQIKLANVLEVSTGELK